MANTKLTTQQKLDLKTGLAGALAQNIKVVNLDDKTTIAYKVMGNTVEFALSVMSPDEKKFRAKVGQYWAIYKFMDNQTVKMDKFDFAVMCEFVWDAYPFSE